MISYKTLASESFSIRLNILLFDFCFNSEFNISKKEPPFSEFNKINLDNIFTSDTFNSSYYKKNRSDYVTHNKTVEDFLNEISLLKKKYNSQIEEINDIYISKIFPQLFSLDLFENFIKTASCHYCKITEEKFLFLSKYFSPLSILKNQELPLFIDRKKNTKEHSFNNTIFCCQKCRKVKEEGFEENDLVNIGETFNNIWETKYRKLKAYFGSKRFPEDQEEKFIKSHDIEMNPREWIARNGHRILCGDMRQYTFKNKKFEKWIHEAYDALFLEKQRDLWNEFLSKEERLAVIKEYETILREGI